MYANGTIYTANGYYYASNMTMYFFSKLSLAFKAIRMSIPITIL